MIKLSYYSLSNLGYQYAPWQTIFCFVSPASIKVNQIWGITMGCSNFSFFCHWLTERLTDNIQRNYCWISWYSNPLAIQLLITKSQILTGHRDMSKFYPTFFIKYCIWHLRDVHVHLCVVHWYPCDIARE